MSSGFQIMLVTPTLRDVINEHDCTSKMSNANSPFLSAMGKSRSATVLLAYLLWVSRQRSTGQNFDNSDDMVPLPPKPINVVQALEILRQGRPIAEPNEGFMDQLHMYEDMGCPTTEDELKSHKIYRRWMNKRQVEESLRTMQAPELDAIIFEDESEDGSPPAQQGAGNDKHMTEVMPGVLAPDGTDETKALAHISSPSPRITIKCRKCRHVLATTPFIIDHKPPPHRDPSSHKASSTGTILPPAQCAHIFLHPLSWMKEVLAEGKMEGRLTCPNKKCNSNIGKFAWTGLRCSCGGWVTPGFGIIRTKIDENVSQGSTGSVSANTGRAQSAGSNQDLGSLASNMAGLRLPPNMKRNGNL